MPRGWQSGARLGDDDDQHYFVRKSSETLRKVEMEIVRHQTRGRNATYTVKRIILPLT